MPLLRLAELQGGVLIEHRIIQRDGESLGEVPASNSRSPLSKAKVVAITGPEGDGGEQD